MKRLTNISVIVLCALLVNILTVGGSNTFSWFSDSKTAAFGVSIGKAEDIVNVKLVCTDDAGIEQSPITIIPRSSDLPEIKNPKRIIVTRIDQKSIPNIYFDITGDLSNYILNIHPIDFLDKDKKLINIDTVSIVPNCNTDQNTTLNGISGINKENYTTGVLSIRYLNGYISEDFNVKFKNRLIMDNYYKLSGDNR